MFGNKKRYITVILPVFIASAMIFAQPFSAYAADGSGNIQLDVPANVPLHVNSSGHIVSPSNSALAIQNKSDFELRIDSLRFRASGGYNVVSDAYQSDLPNSVSIKIGPATDKMNASSCSSANAEVGDDVAWTMSTQEASLPLSKIDLEIEGDVSNLRGSNGESVGSIEWHVVSDTTTNEVKSRLTSLENRMDAEEAKCPLPVGAVLQLSSTDDPNTMYPGTTWTKIEGKVLLGASSSYSLNSTGGSATHTLTEAELPAHSHKYDKSATSTGGTKLTAAQSGVPAHSHGLNSHTHSIPALSGTAASNGAHTHNLGSVGDSGYSMKYYNKDGVVQQNTTSGWARGIGNFNNNQGDNWRMIALSAGAHTHSVTTTANTTGAASGSTASNSASGASESHSHSITLTSTSSTSTGSGTAFSTMMPYRVVNIWERTT